MRSDYQVLLHFTYYLNTAAVALCSQYFIDVSQHLRSNLQQTGICMRSWG